MPSARVVALAVLALAAAPALGQDARYYVALFGSQRNNFQAKYAHTFGTVIKVVPGQPAETHTISWLPATADVHVLRVHSEPGRNFTLDETLRVAAANDERVSMWGPYEVRPRFYDKFAARAADLDSGRFRYRAVDSVIRKTDVTDCIHAITDMDPVFNRGRYPLNRYGDRATAFIVDQLIHRGVILDPARHEELVPLLGIERDPVARRDPPPEWMYPLADTGYLIRPKSRVVRR